MGTLSVITAIVSLVLGSIAKKVEWVDNKMIPLQNLVVGIIFAIVEWVITKDFDTAIALSGLLAGGIYDIFHTIEKLIRTNKK